ncbi:MAG: hypothetical protein H0U99_00615 [Chthoniobacterales bacterium]|nr:hypothetical protein [Chthoniobacterales bacterium]
MPAQEMEQGSLRAAIVILILLLATAALAQSPEPFSACDQSLSRKPMSSFAYRR